MRVAQINYIKEGAPTKYFTFAVGRNDFVATISALIKQNYKVTCKYYTI